jgi:MFS family permease
VRLVLIVITAATLSYSGVFAVGLPALATSLGGATSLGLMVSGWGAGQLVGALAASVTGLPRRWGLLIIGMTLVEAVMFTTLGLVNNAWSAAVLLFVVGIGVSYSSDVALPTFIQTQTPRHLLGRISAVMGLPRVIFEPVSISVLGIALAHSTRWAFAIAALPVLMAGAFLLLDSDARALTTERNPVRGRPADASIPEGEPAENVVEP